MPKSKNSYFKGLNQDNSRSKYDPTNYYDALNVRVVTRDGLSTGSIENEKGNTLAFTIPDVPSETITHPDGSETVTTAETNLKIVGWCVVSKYIILFTTSSINEGGGNGTDQIWKLEYNERTGTVEDLDSGLLTIEDHLIYNGFLKLSTYHRIESEGRFENENTIRIYWTDFNNPLRTVNILDKNLKISKPDLLDTVPDILFSMPYPIRVGNGSLLSGSKVQYAYRLISETGAQSIVSPASPLVTLTTTNPNIIEYYVDTRSDPLATAPAVAESTRSVTFKVEGIDTDYTIIEHLAVEYTSKNTPIFYKFGEDTVPTDGEMEVTLTGSEVRLILTSVEFNSAGTGFSKCKTIDAKNNYLIAGNIIKETSVITTKEWDSRAYRFNREQEAKLIDLSDPITLDGTVSSSIAWDSVPEQHDAINEYNESSITSRSQEAYDNNLQYKYQSNGTTIGGEGKNVSYTFIKHEVLLDNTTTVQHRGYPWVEAERVSTVLNNGTIKADGNNWQHTLNNEFNNFSNPIIEAFVTGYARGEVYRFGIQFYTKKGGVTFVNWIGDIKFPEPTDGFPTAVGENERPNGFPALDTDVKGNSIGIKFLIDVTAIKDKISGYRIVRAERKEADVSRLGTGVIMLFDKTEFSSNAETRSLWSANASDKVGVKRLRWDGDRAGDGGTALFHLPDLPGPNLSNNNGVSGVHRAPQIQQHIILFSPLTTTGFKDALNFTAVDGDYIRTLGYYKSHAVNYRTNDEEGKTSSWEGGGGAGDNSRQSWLWRCKQYMNYKLYHDEENFFIRNLAYLNGGIKLSGAEALDYIHDQDAIFLNTSYGTNNTASRGYPLGVGDDICHIKLAAYWSELPSYANQMTAAEKMQWGPNPRSITSWNTVQRIRANIDPNYGELSSLNKKTAYTNESQVWSFKEVAYVRPVEKQYGGNSFESRSKTSYISTGHYQPINDNVPNITFPEVYGGDTTVHLMDKDYIMPYGGASNQPVQNPQDGLEDPGELKLAVAVLYPCESRINIEYHKTDDKRFRTNRLGWSWNSGKEAYLTTVLNHDEFYMQNNNSETKFVAKDFAVDIIEAYPHRLWISDAKIDGELIDSWKTFRPANILDVDGSYGPINKVINFQDRLTFYQDRAIGIAPINERSLITDSSGVQLNLGTGDVLQDFRYITTTTGTVHQHSVVASTQALYHYDATLRKMFRITQGASPLSDIEGMSSFFASKIDNDIITSDITLRDSTLGGGIGVHSAFDFRNNRALFTFLSPKIASLVGEEATYTTNFTIGFNEFTDSYESLYSFIPEMYLNTGRRLLSRSPLDSSKAYLHDEGNHGEFYGTTYNSEITLLISPEGDYSKIFTNLEYNSEISLADVQQPAETLTSLEVYNDYQTTGNIPLIVDDNIKRRMRHWRHIIGRDSTSSSARARIRDYSIFLKLSYLNNNDKRLVLHDILVSYTPARD